MFVFKVKWEMTQREKLRMFLKLLLKGSGWLVVPPVEIEKNRSHSRSTLCVRFEWLSGIPWSNQKNEPMGHEKGPRLDMGSESLV